MIEKDQLEKQYKLIPISEINISYDKDLTTGYDFTVEDNYTFCTHDGVFLQDTFTMFSVLTEEGQKEAREKLHMTKSLLGVSSIRNIPFAPSKDSILGIYTATRDVSDKLEYKEKDITTIEECFELLKKNHSSTKVTIIIGKDGKKLKTSLGRAILYLLHPDPETIQINSAVNKKKIDIYIRSVIMSDQTKLAYVLENIIKLGMLCNTLDPKSVLLDDLKVTNQFNSFRNGLMKKDPMTGVDEVEKTKKLVQEAYKGTRIDDVVSSGSKPSWSDVSQLVATKGYVMDAEGKPVPTPVKSSLSNGMSEEEFFRMGFSARKGIIDRVLNVAVPGYLTRRIVFACNDIELSDSIEDCGTDRYMLFNVTDKNYEVIVGRNFIRGTSIQTIETRDDAKEFVGKALKLRTPIFCATKKICRTCYGLLTDRLNTKHIGIIAAQSIGEPGTQFIMRTFHTGGVVTKKASQLPTELNEMFNVEEDGLFMSKMPLMIEIQHYKDRKDKKHLDMQSDTLIIKSGSIIIHMSEAHSYEMNVDQPITLYIPQDGYNLAEDTLYIKYEKASPVLVFAADTNAVFSNQIKVIDSIFEARYPIYKVEDYISKLTEQYIGNGQMIDSVHFETVLSNMTRSKSNKYNLYRLDDKENEYTIVGITAVPGYTSFVTQLNVGYTEKGIQRGLIGVEPSESYLDKLFLGKEEPSEYETKFKESEEITLTLPEDLLFSLNEDEDEIEF